MKLIKILSLTLSIILFIFTVSCDIPDIFEIETSPDFNESESSSVGLGNETSSEKVSDNSSSHGEEPPPSPKSCKFCSIEDIHTYVTTGSTDLDDYHSFPDSFPQSSLENFPSFELIKVGYLPIIELFDLNEAGINSVQYVHVDNGNMFVYQCAEKLYDNYFYVEIIYSPGESDVNTVSNTNTVIYDDMSAKDEHDECTIRQNVNGTTVNYWTKYGKIGAIDFNYGNHRIRIDIGGFYGYRLTEEEIDAVYNKFMTAPGSAAFAPFFSEDQAVREEAFARFEANYAAIKNQSE